MEGESLAHVSIDIAVNAEVWNNVSAATDKAWVAAQLRPLLSLKDIGGGELSIALTDDAHMAQLNSQFRNKSGPTNVLSFPASPSHLETPHLGAVEKTNVLLGDIVLSFETLRREAKEKNVSFEAHLSHLLIHGFLHLQGYDHQTGAQAKEMETLEITALAALGIDNPYEKQTLTPS